MSDATTTPATAPIPDFAWKRTSKQRYNEMLNVLPPRDWTHGAFLVGEAYDHEGANYAARYQVYRQVGMDLFIMGTRPVTFLEFKTLILQRVDASTVVE